MLYNRVVPLVGNNVDSCLLKCDYSNVQEALQDPSLYLALGELKGGIDPAGADEHWKTARTAISRIQDAFAKKKLSPKLFFVGAAIANKMSKEIWKFLEKGKICNAANLTDDSQVASICRWLTNL